MVALALIVIASLGIMLAKSAASRSGGSQDSATLQHQELVARDQAASWIVQQVAPTAVVSCDRVMCAALTADRFPSGQLLTLTPASLTPVTSTVVVVTAAVRSMFGTSLGAAYAPAVLASFGSGDAEITIRLMAPHGAAAYQAMFKADLAARQESGSALVNNPRIILSGTAKDQLNAGQVDSRLVLSLADLASYQPIDIVRFDSIGPGAGPDILLRAADLDVNDQAVSMGSSAYTQAMYAYLDKQITKFRPASSQRVALPGGQPVFRVEFTAPSPLGGVQ